MLHALLVQDFLQGLDWRGLYWFTVVVAVGRERSTKRARSVLSEGTR
jgi:hypothetical protein